MPKERERAKTSVFEREEVSITLPVAIITLLALLIATVPLLLLDPQANDGLASFTGLFFIPMTAVALVIQLCLMRLNAYQSVRRGFLWWILLVLPVGTLLLSIPSILAEPEYFEAETVGGFLATLGIMLMLIACAMLFGAILWFFVVFPLVGLAGAIGALVRGDRGAGVRFVMPIILLTLAAIIIFGAMSLDDLLPGRAAGGQIIAALLGIPGSYDVVWPTGLWIVRALVAALIVAWAWAARAEKRRRAARA